VQPAYTRPAVPASTSFSLWRYRFVLALVLTSLTTATALAGGYWYLHAKWANATGIDLALSSGPAANYLILGSDSREFIDSEEDLASFGEVGGQRSDTIIVVRVDPKTRKALLVSFPRDLWVEIPGRGNSKINAAFLDGPQKVIDTLRSNFDIPIHHYVDVDFAGFRNIVEAIGGVSMYVAAPARDPKTGLNVEQAGCVVLDGAQALAWVRSRHYQQFESGQWRSDPTGDFGRITRQQEFLRRLMAQSISSAASNPLRGDNLVDKALANITVDSGLAVGDVLRLARAFRSTDPTKVEMISLPGRVGRAGGQSVVLVNDDEAEPILERLRGSGTDGDLLPSTVRVRVLNGSGTAGIATRTASELQDLGFLPGGQGDADRYGYAQTEIRHRPGEQEKAELLKDRLHGVGRLVEEPNLGNADLVLIVGSDFKGVETPAGDAEAKGAGSGVDLTRVVRVAALSAEGAAAWAQVEPTAPPSGADPIPQC